MLQRVICRSNMLGVGDVCQINYWACRSIFSINRSIKTHLPVRDIGARPLSSTAMFSSPSLRRTKMLLPSLLSQCSSSSLPLQDTTPPAHLSVMRFNRTASSVTCDNFSYSSTYCTSAFHRSTMCKCYHTLISTLS